MLGVLSGGNGLMLNLCCLQNYYVFMFHYVHPWLMNNGPARIEFRHHVFSGTNIACHAKPSSVHAEWNW